MPLPASSLASACRAVADWVGTQMPVDGGNPVRVLVGSPADAVPGESDTDHRLNFFFYRVEPSGHSFGLDPGEPWRVRLHCMVTAFAVPEDSISAGENDLRLLGELVRVFHETPILPEVDLSGEGVRPRVLYHPLSLDELNHLWSTQGDVKMRPSAGYELALVPVVPSERRVPPPLVGALGFESRADVAGRRAAFGGTAEAPSVPRTEVDTGAEDWAPRICLVDGGECAESLTFELGSAELGAFVPRLWVAGEVGPAGAVSLVWESWSAATGWAPEGAPITGIEPSSVALDPSTAASAATETLALPFDDRAGQLLLYAERTYTRAQDGATVTVRSNPILISLAAAGGSP